MESKRLDNAALAAGISPSYINAHGKPQSIAAATKQRLLDAMHRTATAVKATVDPLPAVQVFTYGKKMSLPVAGQGEFHWILTTEEGKQYQGQARGGETLPLPAKLPEGYHTLTLTQDGERSHCRVIVAPARCYEPQALKDGKKLWGTCVQLYTLRSEKNWGIGDFGDLRAMLPEIARRGGAFIGLNPIHALYPANPESASPYSPSSRRWLNVIYIDVNAVDDFRHSKEAQKWWQSSATQQALQAARQTDDVDYTAVTALKLTALRMAWKGFSARNDETTAEFRQFVTREGESLYWQAAYDALHAWQVKQDPMRWGWPAWPKAYQDTDSPEVKAFCTEHADEVNFYLWLQWLAYTQFAECFAEGGAETWCDRELYCLKASVGAPPDILGPLGQNWGLPPMDPHIMVARAYEPFVELLRANMQNCGALRIDHVMSVLRLWWIPYGETADHGAYVQYPVDDLLSILALESKRHRCMVIGEDLGTVPVEIVGKLRKSGVYSYKVLYFENDHEKTFRAPKAYPEQSMAVATTHDLPTLRGYWESGDLTLGKSLGLYPDEVVLRGLYQDRELAKQGLLDALHRYGCLPKRTGHKASLMAMTSTLNRGMQRYIADSNSALLGLQPEDWLEMAEPVNIPGTSTEYPNWRRKLSTTLEAMFADEQVNKLIKDLDKRRKSASKKKPA